MRHSVRVRQTSVLRTLLVCVGIGFVAGCGGDSRTSDAGTSDAGTGDAGTDERSDAGSDASFDAARDDAGVNHCNGSPALCGRAYDDVVYATTHNAMSTEEEGWFPANQGPALGTQLRDGVRAFMLDTYLEGGQTLLCHGTCLLGSRPFVEALVELRTFLERNRGEVITLILEAHIDEPTTAAAFEEAGLLPLLHSQPLGRRWPTLEEMIGSGRRMVVFTESPEVTLPWHHYAYAYVWDTPFSNMTPEDLGCELGRGDMSNSLFVVNHFLTAPVARRSFAEQINPAAFMRPYLERCQAETGQRPNFVAVDFYEVGDLLLVVRELNGV